MGLFDFIRRVIGGEPAGREFCARCRQPYRAGARFCANCNHPRGAPYPIPLAQTKRADQGAVAPPPVRPQNLSGLDAEKFRPMTTAEAMSTIAAAGSMKSAYFDPMNVIPDASLPRIQVIDRTMVGLGLISSEELVHIHDVGRAMSEARGDWSAVQRRGEAAVQLSREERAARRKQKIEESARRKQARAEAIARRRATDIVFLGRGVSRGLADRRSNVEALRGAGLPSLATPSDVSAAMNISIPRLKFLAYHSDAPQRTHYVSFRVPKKSGGERLLSAPHEAMDAAQRWILENVLAKVGTHDAAHGFVAGRSTVTNAAPHVGANTLVNVDLTDFFPSITFPRVMGMFRSLGFSPAVATIFALLCTESPRSEMKYEGRAYFAATGPRALPQGACTSPAISNLIARGIDQRLAGIARKLGWTYTRYADDLSFSRRDAGDAHVGYLLARIRHIAQDEGFEVNEKKTRVLRPNQRQVVTGLVVNDRINVPRKEVRRIRAILHRAKREGLARQNRENHPFFESWLRGMIAYITMVNPSLGQSMRNELDALASGGG
ncbi:MAG TPA: reverse transcriptase family protein [Phycisphaerae bacterium]|nr:reverse transcriptase family protein [Phycisphaerae bacterium]HRW55003.1 reverse transcriptase family protein [Phycisphaerae bacterium]